MIKKDTIVSTTDGRLTLLQWLKKVEGALKNASATAVKGVPQADGKVVFEIDFADGTSIKSDPFELPEKLPGGYAVDEAGNVTLNGGLLIDKLGNVEMGKNAAVDGTLTLNTPQNLVFKTGSILPGGITVDGDGNITINTATFYADSALGADLTGPVSFGSLRDYNGDPLEIAAVSLPAAPDSLEGGIYYCSAIKRYMLGFWCNGFEGGNRFRGLTIERFDDDTADIKFYPDVALDTNAQGVIEDDQGYSIADFAFNNQVSHAKYQHTVTIKFDNQNTAVLCFTAMSSDDTKVNTLLALNRVFKGRRLGCSGGDTTGFRFVYLDTHPANINDSVVGYMDANGFHTDETIGTLKGTGFTIEDDVCIP